MAAGSQGQISTGKPAWLRRRLPLGPEYEKVRRLLKGQELHTVCQEAHCPNQFECYAKGTATFMILGDRCSRNCRFCAVQHQPAGPPDPAEPARVADAVVFARSPLCRDHLGDPRRLRRWRSLDVCRDDQGHTTVQAPYPRGGPDS